MNDAADQLIKALRETAGSRFIAASRLEEHDKRLTRLTAFTSAYIIALTILPYFIKLPAHIMDISNLITVAFAVVILVASLLQYSSRDVVNSEQHHRSALEISEIRRLLLAEQTITQQVLVDFTNRYNAVLQKYSINHEVLDYRRYQLERSNGYPWLTVRAKIVIAIRLFVTKHMPTAILALMTIFFVALLYYGVTNSITIAHD
jgi:hypothetical protein